MFSILEFYILIIQNSVEIFLLHIPPRLLTHLQSCSLQSKKAPGLRPFNDWKLSLRRLTSRCLISLVIGGDRRALFIYVNWWDRDQPVQAVRPDITIVLQNKLGLFLFEKWNVFPKSINSFKSFAHGWSQWQSI